MEDKILGVGFIVLCIVVMFVLIIRTIRENTNHTQEQFDRQLAKRRRESTWIRHKLILRRKQERQRSRKNKDPNDVYLGVISSDDIGDGLVHDMVKTRKKSRSTSYNHDDDCSSQNNDRMNRGGFIGNLFSSDDSHGGSSGGNSGSGGFDSFGD